MAETETEQFLEHFEADEREALGRLEFAVCAGRFYDELGERLVNGAIEGFGVAAVIRGETNHYDYVCAEAARGIMDTQLETGVPCAFGVITCDTMEQAMARAGGGKRDQGRNAALTVARMTLLKQDVNPYRWQVRDA